MGAESLSGTSEVSCKRRGDSRREDKLAGVLGGVWLLRSCDRRRFAADQPGDGVKRPSHMGAPTCPRHTEAPLESNSHVGSAM